MDNSRTRGLGDCITTVTYFCVNRIIFLRFLGTRPVRLIRVQIKSQPAILALSSRTWLNYTHQNLMHFTPLIFDTLDYAWGFSAELCPEGLIGITGNVLR